jgi:hypothetical protein
MALVLRRMHTLMSQEHRAIFELLVQVDAFSQAHPGSGEG